MYGFRPSAPQWDEKQPASDASACSWAATLSPKMTGESPAAMRSELMIHSMYPFASMCRRLGRGVGVGVGMGVDVLVGAWVGLGLGVLRTLREGLSVDVSSHLESMIPMTITTARAETITLPNGNPPRSGAGGPG